MELVNRQQECQMEIGESLPILGISGKVTSLNHPPREIIEPLLEFWTISQGANGTAWSPIAKIPPYKNVYVWNGR
jgi:hypothetical protein